MIKRTLILTLGLIILTAYGADYASASGTEKKAEKSNLGSGTERPVADSMVKPKSSSTNGPATEEKQYDTDENSADEPNGSTTERESPKRPAGSGTERE